MALDLSKLHSAIGKVADLAQSHANVSSLVTAAHAARDAAIADLATAQSDVDALTAQLLAAATTPAESAGIVAVAQALSTPAVAVTAPVTPAVDPVAPLVAPVAPAPVTPVVEVAPVAPVAPVIVPAPVVAPAPLVAPVIPAVAPVAPLAPAEVHGLAAVGAVLGQLFHPATKAPVFPPFDPRSNVLPVTPNAPKA